MTSNNMYTVGDFVFFEESASAPYQIRKIEELLKVASTGAVEAKVTCYFRRRDLSSSVTYGYPHNFNIEGLAKEQLHQLQHRELYVSRKMEILPATHIRGKCRVAMHKELDEESLHSLLNKEDYFFYQLIYDPIKKSLQANKYKIRVGSDFQATVPDIINPAPIYNHKHRVYESLLWCAPTPGIVPGDLEAYVTMCKSLATLARACYPPSSLRQPNLMVSAASASRDTTIQLAMDSLHKAGYSVPRALEILAPPGHGPVLRLDEMEEWSVAEGNLFEEALEKCGKSFHDIQADILPWKTTTHGMQLPNVLLCYGGVFMNPCVEERIWDDSVSSFVCLSACMSLVAFYYMWKTTDHYLQQKRAKAIEESEHRLKQVYIPNYNKPNHSLVYPNGRPDAPVACQGCQATTTTGQWYALGTAPAILKVCGTCWSYWKRYGDLKLFAVSEKLGPMTLVYRCPVQPCDEEFEDKNDLVAHLDTHHPQYGGAFAATVQATPSSRTPRGSMTSSASVASTSSLAGLAADLQGKGAAASRKNFFFLAPPALRFARRLAKRHRGTKRALGRSLGVDMENLEAMKTEMSPDLVKRLAVVVFREKGCVDKIKGAHRLHTVISRIAEEMANESNTLSKSFCANEHSKKMPPANHIAPKQPVAPDDNQSAEKPLQPQSPAVEVTTAAAVGDQKSHTLPRSTPNPLARRPSETAMFQAPKHFQRKRRKFLLSKALRRLCRRPCSPEALPYDIRSKLVDSEGPSNRNNNAPLKPHVETDTDLPSSSY